ncbi:MAG: Isochorismatase hydrolase [uncultured bacterium]|nr:MAG: Isochorismatase hydrolase [uncultured bacterium]OGT24229.1 MAG: nicotinamidase [Gammaproteobacteria bacterium RIFCSPHIGHO2_12_38_15]OGT67536.1 MAG: nicotinamidase [Gammaproteobacteria bacterium RIFCSPLOWO2_02_FULL_38_11]
MNPIFASPKFIASLDIDAQNCFTPLCPMELPVEEGHLIVSELNAQAQFASLRLGSKEAHSPSAVWVASLEKPVLSPVMGGGSNVDVHWPSHAVPGTLGFQLLKGLPAVTDYDFFVWKGVELDLHPYGSCFHDLNEKLSTGMIEFLKQRQILSVIVGGLATDYCVKATVLQLLKAKFKVILNLGACRGVAKETTAKAIEEMKNQGVLFIQCANEMVTVHGATNALGWVI